MEMWAGRINKEFRVNMHTLLCTEYLGSQKDPLQHRKPYSVICNNPRGKRIQNRMSICICICITEAFSVHLKLTTNLKKKTKKRKKARRGLTKVTFE